MGDLVKCSNCGYDPNGSQGGCPCCNQETMNQILVELKKLNEQTSRADKAKAEMLKLIGDSILSIAHRLLLKL